VDRLPGRFPRELVSHPAGHAESSRSLVNPRVPLLLTKLGLRPSRLIVSRREDRLPRNYLGAEAPFRHLVLTMTAWPLRASRDTPALLARLV
jgi:hypothetical protein